MNTRYVHLEIVNSLAIETLNSPQFQTVLSDIQLAINNKPLTFVDLNSDIDAITPNKLVSPSSHFSNLIITDVNELLANDIDVEAEETRLAFVNTLGKRDIIVDRFRIDWYNAYLTSLRPTFKNSLPFPYKIPEYFSIRSVVLIKHPIKPKPFWNLAKIVELIEGEDGRVGVARVRSINNTISTISISKLFPLELQSSETQGGLEEEEIYSSDLSDQINLQHQSLSDSSANSGGSVVLLEETLSESSD